MAQVLSPQTNETTTTASRTPTSPAPNPNLASLPPIMTSPPVKPQPNMQRVPSYTKHRLSTFSTRSNTSNPGAFASGSRPQSMAFPQFHSSLPYALVRDFAYASHHLLHYGPPPERESGISTPASEAQHRRLSDPMASLAGTKHDTAQKPWSSGSEHLPTTSFGDHDGPPWSEDEDLASPVVTSSRHRKNRSNPASLTYHSSNGDASQSHYAGEGADSSSAPGGDFITYPPNQQARTSSSQTRRDSHFHTALPNRSFPNSGYDLPSSPDSPSDEDDYIEVDENRFSKDYQFTIASPDEEMHGRAVALFDFARENENELPLVEGQVILVSYRHGQGWLVAQDPKTGETGLVPEEYVRLLRDIEGGLHGLINGGMTDDDTTPTDSAEAKTPTQLDHHPHPLTDHLGKKDEYYQPVVSTFSTSREDYQPWPHNRISGSQVSTPTLPKAAYSPVKENRSRSELDEAKTPVVESVSAEEDTSRPAEQNKTAS